MIINRPPKPPKYVYFLRRKDGLGPIKVGCSRMPEVRLREFYRWSSNELEMLTSSPGGHDVERQLHHMFAAYRSHMEWFAPSARLLSIIDMVAAGKPILEAIAATEAIEPMQAAA